MLFVYRRWESNMNWEFSSSTIEQPSASSEDGVTGMGFIFLPKTTKKKKGIKYATMIFQLLELRKQSIVTCGRQETNDE